jgi:hypothetical protein
MFIQVIIDECRLIFPFVYYRVKDSLPCLQPADEGMDKSHDSTPLSDNVNITDHVRAILKPLLKSNNFPLLSKRLSLENITNQLSKRYGTIEKVNKINFEVILTQLENSL